MENNQLNMIKKCRASLIKEGILKSVLIGMAVGLGVCFVVAFVTWFVEFKGLWLSVGLGLGLWVATSLLLYFIVYKPDNRAVMKRMDRAGLEERMITMYELEGDTSYMAERQRADATATVAAAAATGVSLVSVHIAALFIVLAAVFAPLGAGWAVVTGLSDYGIIPTGMELIQDGGSVSGVGRYYTVTFEVGKDGGGTLRDTTNPMSRAAGSVKLEQKVKAGSSTETVLALAQCDEEGTYYFVKWVDELGKEYSNSPYLSLSEVTSSKTFTAVFALVEDTDDDDFAYFFDPDNSGDNNKDGPSTPGDDKGDDKPMNPGDGPGSEGPGTPGDGLDSDTVIDGETQYGEVFGDYYGDAMGDMSDSSSGRPPELGDMLEGYFDSL